MLKNKSVQDSLVVGALGLILGIFSIYSFLNSKVKAEWILSPYLFPMLLAILAILLALSLFLEGRREFKTGTEPAHDKISIMKIVVVIAISLVYFALLSLRVDFPMFIPATALFLAAMMWFLGERRPLVLVLVAVITPVVLFFLFKTGLGVRLP